MNWLQKLRLIDMPENTTLESAQLSLRGGLPWWVGALLLLVGVGAAFFFYFRERAKLGWFRRLFLGLLRSLLLVGILFLLLRPMLQVGLHGERPRPIVVLLDRSESMSLRDQRVSLADKLRAAQALGLLDFGSSVTEATLLEKVPADKVLSPERRELLAQVLTATKLDLLENLKKQGPVQIYTFGRRLEGRTELALQPELSPYESMLQHLTADEPQTALANALDEVLNRAGNEPPAAIVLCTDGRDNAKQLTLEEAAKTCQERGVPLHIYGVGSSRGGMLLLKEVNVPRTIFVDEKIENKDDPLEVPIRWQLRGYKSGKVLLKIKFGTQEFLREYTVTEQADGSVQVAWQADQEAKKVQLREGEDVRDVLKIVPEKGKEGKRTLTAQLLLREHEEQCKDNFEREVQVKNSRVKVLYVENAPRREYKFVQPILERDRRVLSRYVLLEGDPRLAEAKPDPVSGSQFLEKFPDTFPDPGQKDPDQRAYDLLVLGDVPFAALGKAGVEAVEKFVKEGGGLICLAGQKHLPNEYAQTPLADLLPVTFERQDRPAGEGRTQPFKPTLTYQGEHSALLYLADDAEANLKLWQEELWQDKDAQFVWHYPVTGVRSPAVTTLLAHPEAKIQTRDGEKPMPLLAAHYFGKGEVLFFACDETWRLRYNQGDKRMARLWGQIISGLGLPHLLGNSQRVQLELVGAEPLVGRGGELRARLLNEKYEPLQVQTIPGKVTLLDALDGQRASWTTTLRAIPGLPGEYRAALPIHHDAGKYVVEIEKGESLEAAKLPYRVDPPPGHEREMLGLNEEGLLSLARLSGGRLYHEEDLPELAKSVTPAKSEFTLKQEVLLWNPLALVAIILVLTLEWLVRKFSNLS